MTVKPFFVALAGLLLAQSPADAEAVLVPPPAHDLPASPAQRETAVLAGGCFWGVQGVFQHVKGVVQAVSGYAGGAADTAQYETVSTGTTGHAESVRITYDPTQISYGTLLRIFFSVAHDPTQKDRQNPDIGPQYRSAIFPQSSDQAQVARDYIAQLDAAHVFPRPIATRIEDGARFYPAEGYHQDFLARHPAQSYIAAYDLPKIGDLERLFPDIYRDQPALVSAARP